MPIYTKEELEAVHNKLLAMAQVFVDFCKEHDLLCYFCGGGCIGSVRNQGFIPWDDDLDFFMPREDYERLKTLWVNEGRYILRFPSRDYYNGNNMITLRDAETTQIKTYQAEMDIEHGLAIDIFPLDGCPTGWLKRRMQYIYAMVQTLFATNQIPEKHGALATLGGKVLLGLFPKAKTRWHIWHWAEKRMSRFPIAKHEKITELCTGPVSMKYEYPAEYFASAVWLPFEDTEMPVPVGYDGYLRIAFGDYMTPPPPEKQVAHHACIKLDAERSYREYKGVYYCTKEDA